MKNSSPQINIPDKVPNGRIWLIVRIALFIVAIIIILMSVKLILEYTSLVEEREKLEKNLQKLKEEKRELEYYLNSPIDDYYIKKFAWDLYRLVPSDEKIYVSDPTE